MHQPPLVTESLCPICSTSRRFTAPNDFWACRDELVSNDCPNGGCVVRERALARALFSLVSREKIRDCRIHEAAPLPRGLTIFLQKEVTAYIGSGLFSGHGLGEAVGSLRNEDLEQQTFNDDTFHFVIHLDVLEHLYNPFTALTEIHRTLKVGGYCLFTAPTEQPRLMSEQVAFMEHGGVQIVGEPEYHGNPQNPEEGSLVTWRYGYDLPLLITRNTPFTDVEVRRYQSHHNAIAGYMNEVYILAKT